MPDVDAGMPVNSIGEQIQLAAQDRSASFSWTRLLSITLSLGVIGAALVQVSKLDAGQVFALVPASPLFWSVFVLYFFIGPAGDWFIFYRLWGLGLPAFAALIRKMVYNELLLGYLGEVWFYSWARKNGEIEGSPFGAVKDVAVLSAVAGNIMTLVMVLAIIPYADLLPIGDNIHEIVWSLAFVLVSSVAITLWRKAVFSLSSGQLSMIFTVHMARTLAQTGLTAVLWHLVLPDIALTWWLVLATVRLLITRLPFIPNKDVAFAGIVVAMTSSGAMTASLMAMMAGLIVLANLGFGMALSMHDLRKGGRVDRIAR